MQNITHQIVSCSAITGLSLMLADLFAPDPDWSMSTCGECGWCGPTWPNAEQANCRRVAFRSAEISERSDSVVEASWPACPAFVRRTEGGA